MVGEAGRRGTKQPHRIHTDTRVPPRDTHRIAVDRWVEFAIELPTPASSGVMPGCEIPSFSAELCSLLKITPC